MPGLRRRRVRQLTSACHKQALWNTLIPPIAICARGVTDGGTSDASRVDKRLRPSPGKRDTVRRVCQQESLRPPRLGLAVAPDGGLNFQTRWLS